MSVIGIWTDIHFGVSKNNSDKLETCVNILDQMSTKMKEHNVDTTIFCGDFFHSRDFLSVNTFHKAHNSLRTFADGFDHTYFIVGNHDTHLKSSNTINSVEQFAYDKLSVYKDYSIADIGGKQIALCPWGYYPEKDTDHNIAAAFGHFDFTGAALCGSTHNGAYTMDQLTKVAPVVFSGHFHIQQEYSTKTGSIISVGSPYEQNWGDVGNPKGFYIFDTDTSEYEFIKLDYPEHISIRWSRIKKFDTSRITNNYLKLVIDSDYEYNNVIKVVQAFTKLNPKSIELDYQFSKELSNIQTELGDISITSHEEAINKYIDGLDLKKKEKESIRVMAINMFKDKQV